ncbi:acyl-CoA carboxylase subunit epsilon [Georgenia sp. MJ206]|uniref:acyl-CoA carboxylase subunit epsilon n=1 Tax=Georgenia wangjunii TaxID=3117730 RepID=UPI002F26CFF8
MTAGAHGPGRAGGEAPASDGRADVPGLEEVTTVPSPDEGTDDTDWSGAGTDDVVAAALGPAGVRDLPGHGEVHTHTTVRVLRGDPDDIELAALVAGIVAARGVTAEPEVPVARPAPWSDHARPLRLPPVPGTDAWRWSLQR